MLRRLVLTPALALAALSATPADAYKVLCVAYQETIENVTGPIFIDGPVPVLPNKACVPFPVEGEVPDGLAA